MPNLSSQADVFRDWESIGESCLRNADLLVGVEPLRDELAGTLGEARGLKAQQENLQGNRQAVTQQLQQVIDRGTEQARKLRAFIKSRLGTRNEHLAQFGIPPNRKRSRKAKTKPTPPPAAGNPPTNPVDTKPAA